MDLSATPVAPIYAALIALLFVALSVRTLRLRHRFAVAVGTGGERELERAIRAHAYLRRVCAHCAAARLFPRGDDRAHGLDTRAGCESADRPADPRVRHQSGARDLCIPDRRHGCGLHRHRPRGRGAVDRSVAHGLSRGFRRSGGV